MNARLLGGALCMLATAAGTASVREGHVVQATRSRVYLDAGAAEGLHAGAVLEIRRRGSTVGRCRIADLSDHRASCTGAAARTGDTFALAPETTPAEAPTLRATPLSAAARDAEKSALQAAALAPVEFRGAAKTVGFPGSAPTIDVELAHATWAASGTTPANEERLDVNARGVPLGAGMELWLDLSARHWNRQAANTQFRPGAATQLYVWEAQVSARTEHALFGSLGRINPWNAPGAPRIDGAQLGFRSQSGNEIGLYGGAVPDPSTLTPGINRGTGGLFWGLQRRAIGESSIPILINQGRIAVVTTPEGGTRFEAESSGQASLFKLVDLSADVRVGAGGTASSGLEAVRVDLGAHPIAPLFVSAGFRYLGLALPQFASTGAPTGGPSRDLDATITYTVIAPLQISAAAGESHDLSTGMQRAWFGPDVALPTLFGARGGLIVGYREERGWLAGRSAWLQATTKPVTWLRLLARLSWTQDTRPDVGTEQSVGLFASAAARVGEHVDLRLDFLTRADPVSLGGKGVPAGDGGFFKAVGGGSF